MSPSFRVFVKVEMFKTKAWFCHLQATSLSIPHTFQFIFVYSWLTVNWINSNTINQPMNLVLFLDLARFPLLPFTSDSCFIWIRFYIVHFKGGIEGQPTNITPRERGHAFSNLKCYVHGTHRVKNTCCDAFHIEIRFFINFQSFCPTTLH